MWKVLTLAGLITCIAVSSADNNNKKVVCYHGTWSTYRHGLGNFGVENIDPFLCTHLVYTFVGISESGEEILVLDPYLDLPDGRDNIGKFVSLKEKNPELKLLLAIGGWNEGSRKYSNMANDPSKRSKFIANTIEFLLEHGFDGFDLDWEYPNARDSTFWSLDVENFSKLLEELKDAFKPHGLILSAAVSAVGASASNYYQIPEICNHLDLVNLMTYDMNGGWDAVTGHNAPLFKGEGDENLDKDAAFTVDASVRFWLSSGCSPDKLILGVPTYGRTFKLASTSDTGVRAPSSGYGIAGAFTSEQGYMGYNEICSTLQTGTWTQVYDTLARVPYAFNGNDWVSFDDVDSIALKTNYALSHDLGGVMVWAIDVDDFLGTCHGEDFPLIRTINKVLGRESGSIITTTTTTPETEATSKTPEVTTTTDAPETTTTDSELSSESDSTTTADSESASLESSDSESTTASVTTSECTEETYMRDPSSCSKFLMCVLEVDGSYYTYSFSCPENTLWDQSLQICNHASNVDCST